MAPNIPADERFGPKHYFLKEYDSKSSALKGIAQNCTGLASSQFRVIFPKFDFIGQSYFGTKAFKEANFRAIVL
jgi:hypothetical protein